MLETVVMARRVMLYEVVDARTGEVRTRHRTRQAALDAWRTGCVGVPIQIRRIGHTTTTLVMAGIWLEGSAHTWPTGHEPSWAAASGPLALGAATKALPAAD